MPTWGKVLVAVIVVVVLLLIFFFSSYIKAAPDTAIMISGFGKKKILIGKAGFRIPFLQRTDKLSLRAFQVDIKTDEPIPTNEFININVDGVANLKISSNSALLERAFETLLNMSENELKAQVQQILQGNMREIIGTEKIKTLVQDRQGVADKVKENVVPDMEKLGIELVNFNIQSFSDSNDVIVNLGIDNISQISKDAAIAKANAERDVAIARADASMAANDATVKAELEIAAQNNALSLKKSELKSKEDTAKADADAAYSIQQQKRQLDINNSQVDAEIAKKSKEITLNEKNAAVKQQELDAEVNKKADAEKYAAEQRAAADLFTRQKKAEAELYETQKEADAVRARAEADAAAKVAQAEAAKQAALAEAEGIKAKGEAEAQAIRAKADAMKAYNDAATLQLILDSGVIPATVKAYAEPTAAALGKIDNITMYGEGNTAKLTEEINKNGSQIITGLEKTFGIDIKSVIAGYLGGKIIESKKSDDKKDDKKDDKNSK